MIAEFRRRALATHIGKTLPIGRYDLDGIAHVVIRFYESRGLAVPVRHDVAVARAISGGLHYDELVEYCAR
jgi:hypothetical protein